MEVNCESMAVIGATLANGGTCPTTLDSIIKPEHVRDVLSLLHSCGFYEYSGQFAFKVRLQKKIVLSNGFGFICICIYYFSPMKI